MSLTRPLVVPFDLSPSMFDLFEEPEMALSLDIFNPSGTLFSSFLSVPFDQAFDAITDVISLTETPFTSIYRRVRAVDGLGLGADRLKEWDRKHTWTAELKGGADRKYQYTTEIKGLEGRKYKWTAEIESPEKKYSWTAEIKGENEGNAAKKHDGNEVAVKIKEIGSNAGESSGGQVKTKEKCSTHEVEIEEPDDHAATILKRAFERRAGAVAKLRGKRPMLSPEKAAVVIEKTFRAYLIRRSKSLRALRELAAAKSKLKELRASFNAYSYRQTVARDSNERLRFSERIISLILTVDAIQGADIMVRAGRRSMLDELEAMLDAVDPHDPRGKLRFMKR
ncbi:BAG family molecular chaperone regulator 7 [Gossypium australe]|uniref:BAG family molecular chaperone regulator 7 n=1 Tax=Gossypium australe TaxID=47621 RepID=A0A5B6UZ72_9ROSI|nr:BAG family molecular chaperone regulator 7 [Gossypium australe]